jgi:hypothetical protein
VANIEGQVNIFLSSQGHFKQASIGMRCCASFLLLLTIITSCSKRTGKERTNFAEVTIGSQKFVFDSLEAVFDTSFQGSISCEFRLDDRTSNSNMIWKTLSGSKRINGMYKYPGELFPGASLVYLHTQTYVNRVPGTYQPKNDSLALTILRSEKGRMSGTLSGTMFCLTCNPYGLEVPINGEFEMPYRYQ